MHLLFEVTIFFCYSIIALNVAKKKIEKLNQDTFLIFVGSKVIFLEF